MIFVVMKFFQIQIFWEGFVRRCLGNEKVQNKVKKNHEKNQEHWDIRGFYIKEITLGVKNDLSMKIETFWRR